MPFALALASMAPSSSSPSSKWQREIMPFARDFSIAHTHKSPQYCTFTILRRHDEIANNKFTRNEIKSTTLLIDLAVRRIFGDHKSRPCALATTKYFLNFIRNTHVCGYVYYHWKKIKIFYLCHGLHPAADWFGVLFLHRVGIPGWSSFHMKYTSDSEALDRKLW